MQPLQCSHQCIMDPLGSPTSSQMSLLQSFTLPYHGDYYWSVGGSWSVMQRKSMQHHGAVQPDVARWIIHSSTAGSHGGVATLGERYMGYGGHCPIKSMGPLVTKRWEHQGGNIRSGSQRTLPTPLDARGGHTHQNSLFLGTLFLCEHLLIV